MKPPLLSIITVVLNPGPVIERTFQSIAKFKTSEVEYLVLDGGSTDGTQELIQQYAHIIDYQHSRPDKGIYDAMNTAAQLAKGQYLLNINAGDELLNLPLSLLQTVAAQQTQLLCCGVLTEHHERVIPEWSTQLKYYNTLPHQGCFYHRELFTDLQYDTTFRVFADFDLNQRLFQQRIRTIVSPTIVARHDMGGISNNPRHAKELFSIVRKNFGIYSLLRSWLHFKKEALHSRLTAQ